MIILMKKSNGHIPTLHQTFLNKTLHIRKFTWQKCGQSTTLSLTPHSELRSLEALQLCACTIQNVFKSAVKADQRSFEASRVSTSTVFWCAPDIDDFNFVKE